MALAVSITAVIAMTGTTRSHTTFCSELQLQENSGGLLPVPARCAAETETGVVPAVVPRRAAPASMRPPQRSVTGVGEWPLPAQARVAAGAGSRPSASFAGARP